ncbi:MAG: galactokinase [Pseudonocardia sp.]|nr:galactokinase [Pseudonocardia sp.]
MNVSPAVTAFRAAFGHDPEVAWHAPGRVNVIGEHTDYNDGFVLPFALGLGVIAVAARAANGLLRARSMQYPADAIELEPTDLRPGKVTGWVSYPAGVLWQLRRVGLPVEGIELLLDGALPSGAGQSSSAAVECAVGMAVNELFGLALDRIQVADAARRAESDFVGMPCGLMDQYASLLCTEGSALFLDTRSGKTEQIPLDFAAADTALLVVDTASPHRLVTGQYAARRRDCEQAARALGVAALRDVTEDELAGLLPRLDQASWRARVRHVVTENARVLRAVALLRRGCVADIGPLLTASHVSLRDDYQVSSPEQDSAVRAALDAGAFGARMIGGGFGGSVIALVAAGRQAEVTDAVATSDVISATGAGLPTPICTSVRPSAGARRLEINATGADGGT